MLFAYSWPFFPGLNVFQITDEIYKTSNQIICSQNVHDYNHEYIFFKKLLTLIKESVCQ